MEDNHSQLITSDITKAKLLNNYFSSVFVKFTDINFFELNVNQSISDTIETIDKLNVSKAPGPDGIHTSIIKECKESFLTVFHVILKKSLNEGLLPKQWKQTNVRALFKKGKQTKCSNYRPVSLTSIVCKIFETIIRDKITHFLNLMH